MPVSMYKYHDYIILSVNDLDNPVSVHDPNRVTGDRCVYRTETLEQAMIWIDEQSLIEQKENAK